MATEIASLLSLLVFALLLPIPSSASEAAVRPMKALCPPPQGDVFVDSLQGQAVGVCPGRIVSIFQKRSLVAYRHRRITVGLQLAEAAPANSQVSLLLSIYAGTTLRQFTSVSLLSPVKGAKLSLSLFLPQDVDDALIQLQSSGRTQGDVRIGRSIFVVDPRTLRDGQMSPVARVYLDGAARILRRSLFYAEQKWSSLEANLFLDATGAESTQDTHASIMIAVRALVDRHAKVIDPRDWRKIVTSPRSLPVVPEAIVEDGVAYLKPPALIAKDIATGNDFAERLVAAISRAEPQAKAGWIVDLRGNTGGSLWPVLLALSPFFEDGDLGYFQDRDGEFMPWHLAQGAIFAGSGENNRLRAGIARSVIRSKLAVLVDGTTMSAAEALAVAFKGRPNTVLVGTPTAGFTTGVVTHKLSDGLSLNISESYYADAAKSIYSERVAPDLTICAANSDDAAAVDPWMCAARAWLASLPVPREPERSVQK